ncbi:hypothetical protein [Streptomyces sp. NPDC058045]|uniref:hypothetical protein n=1 Tax=Streptomyces sp. NPDC058045 TaxID=3346311 RepID=UPI0036E5D905
MGDTGRRTTTDLRRPIRPRPDGGPPPRPPGQEPTPMPRLARYALAVCVLAVAAAVVSFVQGVWLVGVLWVLLAGLSSNMTWYCVRRARAAGSPAPTA